MKVNSHPTAADVPSEHLSADVTLEAELYVHEHTTKLRRKTTKAPAAERATPECRIMALCTFPLSAVYTASRESTALYYIAVGCSDGLIRYVAWVHNLKI